MSWFLSTVDYFSPYFEIIGISLIFILIVIFSPWLNLEPNR